MPPQQTQISGDNGDSAKTPLRVCCYGSSNKNTRQEYTREAYTLGQILGRRGHTCVNGGGSTGCMGFMNQGVQDVDGKVTGVIHKMFVKHEEGNENHWAEGCHEVFKTAQKGDDDGKVQLIVASGETLQERKRLLVQDADALVVLPGGPGTFDELWEMACAKQIGLISIPIVCVNVNGYYDPFQKMLDRAHEDSFLYKLPTDILHFEDSSVEAIQYIEKQYAAKATEERKNKATPAKKKLQRNPSMLKRMMSAFNAPTDVDTNDDVNFERAKEIRLPLVFIMGIAVGIVMKPQHKR